MGGYPSIVKPVLLQYAPKIVLTAIMHEDVPAITARREERGESSNPFTRFKSAPTIPERQKMTTLGKTLLKLSQPQF